MRSSSSFDLSWVVSIDFSLFGVLMPKGERYLLGLSGICMGQVTSFGVLFDSYKLVNFVCYRFKYLVMHGDMFKLRLLALNFLC